MFPFLGFLSFVSIFGEEKKKKKPAAARTQVQQCLAHLRKQLRPLLNAMLAKGFSLLHPKIFLSLMTAQPIILPMVKLNKTLLTRGHQYPISHCNASING
jgi:hypothetical protein